MALTEFQIKNAKAADKQQKLSDSGGLFLLVHPNGSKYWRMAYRFGGKQKLLAVGKYPSTTLAQARLKRDEAKALLSEGKDPAEVVSMKAKKAVVAQEQETARIETALTFEVIAREWFELNSTKWKASHASKIINRLKADIFPWLGSKGIADLTAPQLLEALRRIEARGAIETAHRALSDCSQIFRYAIASGRAKRNIASDLRGALAPTNGTHFASITEPAQIGELMRKIDGYGGGYITRAALALAPLVLVRPGELRHAEWQEFDLDNALWTIPGEKMKAGREHIVPLSNQVVAILRDIQPLTGAGRYVFAGAYDAARPMSENTVNKVLRALGYDTQTQITGHGFRHMASTLLNEQGYNPDAIEAQLAHKDHSVRGVYNKAKYLAERRVMMQAWADYLMQLKSGVAVKAFKRG
ncbi:MAG: tyrosine-type recombinase/integrase [Sulfuriferula sp.]